MNKFLIAFCSVVLVSTLTVFAYNSQDGPGKSREGIIEHSLPGYDSLLQRGKQLVREMDYSDQDLEAIATYLNNRQ